MANKTLTQATALAGVNIASDDELWIWDVTAAALRKCTRIDLVGGVITGGGTVATGGFTLTAPATGTSALLETANTFTSAQTIDTTSIIAFQILYGSVQRMNFTFSATLNQLQFQPIDFGTTVGSRIILGRNSNASTPAAGHLRMDNLSGASYRLWPDASGNLRIHTSDPTNANDTTGTVVGTQTSSLDSKDVLGEPDSIGDVLAAVQTGAEAVRRFVYKSGSFNGQEFSGVVVDYAPRYGMDRDDEHPAGKSLNVVNAIGDLLMAVAHLAERVDALENA